MPYDWSLSEDGRTQVLRLWPYRSLPRKGFVLFIAATCTFLTLPLLAVLGTHLLWGLLPFMALVVAGIWLAFNRSYRDAELLETLELSAAGLDLRRRDSKGLEKRWQANPYWVSVQLYPTGGAVPHYLTLKGNGREVELGAFLSEGERKALAEELRDKLADLARR